MSNQCNLYFLSQFKRNFAKKKITYKEFNAKKIMQRKIRYKNFTNKRERNWNIFLIFFTILLIIFIIELSFIVNDYDPTGGKLNIIRWIIWIVWIIWIIFRDQ